jgi:capsular exopolysaccharide synthesis family protein
MKSTQPNTPKSEKLDGSKVLRFLLQYEDYFRLMAMLFAGGLLAGAGYYVYARSTYESTSLIRVNQFVDATRAASGGQRENQILLMRSLSRQLLSDYYQLETAKRLGVATNATSAQELRAALIPAVRIGFLDQQHMQLRVVSFLPQVVREFPRALMEAYEEARKRARDEFRDKAIERYVQELAEVRTKVTSQLDSRLKYEEESALASAQIELERLSNVPVQQVRVRYKLEEMDRIAKVLQEQSNLSMSGKLALLTSIGVEKDDPLAAGRIIRRTGDSRVGAPATFQSPDMAKDFTQVVVQPDMVDGLQPWQELDKKRRALEEKFVSNRARYLEDHPEMIKLRDELREVNSALELELEVARKAFDLERDRLKEELVNLDGKLPAYYQAAKSYDEKKLSYELMQKGQLAWDKAYEQLAKQIESLEFNATDESAFSLEFRGFTDIRSEAPVSPSKNKLLMLGCLLGFSLATGVPFVLRKMDSTVTDLNEFEGSLGIPGIGLVPLSSPKVLEEVNRSSTLGAKVPNALLECFRLIRSSIMLNPGPKGEPRVIMLTSARPGEGKTTVSANVAWAFSSMGEKTLLIDCDLRRGRVHGVAGVPNLPGLTRLLSGQAHLDECLVKSEAENLWLLPRGPVLAGTTELLNTPVFENLLNELRGRFSRIILDTPPVLGLSETAFLQNHADGVVLIVRSASTTRADATLAFQQLQKLGGHFFGFVLNRVDFSKIQNQYYYYYYSSNYYDSNWHDEDEQDHGRNPSHASRSQEA